MRCKTDMPFDRDDLSVFSDDRLSDIIAKGIEQYTDRLKDSDKTAGESMLLDLSSLPEGRRSFRARTLLNDMSDGTDAYDSSMSKIIDAFEKSASKMDAVNASLRQMIEQSKKQAVQDEQNRIEDIKQRASDKIEQERKEKEKENSKANAEQISGNAKKAVAENQNVNKDNTSESNSKSNQERLDSRPQNMTLTSAKFFDDLGLKDTARYIRQWSSFLNQSKKQASTASKLVSAAAKTISPIAERYLPSKLTSEFTAIGQTLTDLRAKINESAFKEIRDNKTSVTNRNSESSGWLNGASAGDKAEQIQNDNRSSKKPVKDLVIDAIASVTGNSEESRKQIETAIDAGGDSKSSSDLASFIANHVSLFDRSRLDRAAEAGTAAEAGSSFLPDTIPALNGISSIGSAAGAAARGSGLLAGLGSFAASGGLTAAIATVAGIASSIASTSRRLTQQGNLQGDGMWEGAKQEVQNRWQDVQHGLGLTDVSSSDLNRYRKALSKTGFDIDSDAGQQALDLQKWAKDQGIDSQTALRYGQQMIKAGKSAKEVEESFKDLKQSASKLGADFETMSSNAASITELINKSASTSSDRSKAQTGSTELNADMTSFLKQHGANNADQMQSVVKSTGFRYAAAQAAQASGDYDAATAIMMDSTGGSAVEWVSNTGSFDQVAKNMDSFVGNMTGSVSGKRTKSALTKQILGTNWNFSPDSMSDAVNAISKNASKASSAASSKAKKSKSKKKKQEASFNPMTGLSGDKNIGLAGDVNVNVMLNASDFANDMHKRITYKNALSGKASYTEVNN